MKEKNCEKVEKLADINEIEIDKNKTVMERGEEFLEYVNNEFYEHQNDGYVVRHFFSEGNYTATDAILSYLRQIAELKY